MKLPNNVFKNISEVYKRYFTDNIIGTVSTSDSIRTAKSVLKLFDMDFKKGIMYDLTKTNKPYEPKNCSFKITPFELNRIDEDDLNIILNKNGSCAKELLPLLDCIGYTIREDSSRLVLCFVGSPTYELWKTSYYNEDNTMSWRDVKDDFYNKNLSKIKWSEK